jgi:hypothetical protein
MGSVAYYPEITVAATIPDACLMEAVTIVDCNKQV